MESLDCASDSGTDDPYAFVPRVKTDASDESSFGEQILYEGAVDKQSRHLRVWRRRWLVLTPTRVLTFRAEGRYDEPPTEEHLVVSFRGACVLDDDEAKAVDTATPFSCLLHSPMQRTQRAIVQLRVDSHRFMLLDVVPADSTTDARRKADELATAAVNASCAVRTLLPEYRLAGAVHAFEPVGAVSLRDRYNLGRELGRGTFGTVFHGRCLQSHRAVAVKRVSLLLSREQVWQEVEILRAVRHPHVVRLLNYLEDGRSLGYLVMELLPGGNLYSQVGVTWRDVA